MTVTVRIAGGGEEWVVVPRDDALDEAGVEELDGAEL
jgi:hypothetical protein